MAQGKAFLSFLKNCCLKQAVLNFKRIDQNQQGSCPIVRETDYEGIENSQYLLSLL